MYWCVGEIEREIERENEMVFWITTTNNIDELILFRVYSFFCQQSTHSFGWFEPNLIECICSYTARESTITEKNWGRKRLKWSDRGGGGEGKNSWLWKREWRIRMNLVASTLLNTIMCDFSFNVRRKRRYFFAYVCCRLCSTMVDCTLLLVDLLVIVACVYPSNGYEWNDFAMKINSSPYHFYTIARTHTHTPLTNKQA